MSIQPLPKNFIVGCVVYATKMLNNLPFEYEFSDTLSQATLIMGASYPNYNEMTK